jgi:hypothetical protein
MVTKLPAAGDVAQVIPFARSYRRLQASPQDRIGVGWTIRPVNVVMLLPLIVPLVMTILLGLLGWLLAWLAVVGALVAAIICGDLLRGLLRRHGRALDRHAIG